MRQLTQKFCTIAWLALASLAVATPFTAQGSAKKADQLLVVDCMLPGQVRKLGGAMTFMTARRPVKTSAEDCELRGGEYTAYDRANYASALNVWLPLAKQGDKEAQTFVGEIFEKGLGTTSDPAAAAIWYRKAADQGFARAQINLGYLYEKGSGVEADPVAALNWYRMAAGIQDAIVLETDMTTALQGRDAEINALQQELDNTRHQLDELRGRNRQLKRKQDMLRKERDAAAAIQDGTRVALLEAQLKERDRESSAQHADIARFEQTINGYRDQLTRLQSTTREQAEQLAQTTHAVKTAQAAEANARLSQSQAIKKAEAKAARAEKLAETAAREAQAARDAEAKANARAKAAESLAQATKAQATGDAASRIAKAEQLQQAALEALKKAEAAETRAEAAEQAARTARDQASSDTDIRIAEAEKSAKSAAEAAKTAQAAEARARAAEAAALAAREQAEAAAAEKIANAEKLTAAALLAAQTAKAAEAKAKAAQEAAEKEVAAKVEEVKKLAMTMKPAASSRAVYTAQNTQSNSIEVAIAPPSIQLIDPPLVITRSPASIALNPGVKNRSIVGRVHAVAGLKLLTVNDISLETDEKGLFETDVPVTSNKSLVRIAAVDKLGNRSQLEFMLIPKAKAKARKAILERGQFGKYYALVIGNEQYQTMPDLDTAIEDAREVSRVLENRFGFKVSTLTNATRYQILTEFNKMRSRLTEKDNLLVYYAGHGELDHANLRAHWLPIDAEADSDANWISTVAITDILNAMSAKHVMLVVDSCYSGAMTRSAIGRLEAGKSTEARVSWLKALAKARSRTVLTSGGLQPVVDGGGGKHSLFAKHFLNVLESIDEPIEGQRLYHAISARVLHAALNLHVEQKPEYAPLRFAGHESGDFLFLPVN